MVRFMLLALLRSFGCCCIEDKCHRIALYYNFLRSPVAPWEQKCKQICSPCICNHIPEPPNGPDPTRVIGLTDENDFLYYDRSNPTFIYVGRGSKFGNPERGDNALPKYKDHLISSGLVNEINELQSKILVCHCVPDKPCHAEILAEYANNEGWTISDNLLFSLIYIFVSRKFSTVHN